jgi:UDP-glucose 4-epimerase
MKALIIGAEGFVGSHLRKALPDSVGIDDRSFNKKDREGTVVKSILDDLEPEVKEADVVINAACRDIRRSIDDPISDAQVNILGTLNVLNTCRKHNKKVVFISSVSIHSQASHYAVSKLSGEHYANLYRRWIPTYIVRLSNVFGKGDTESVIGKWIAQDQITLIDPDHTRDFTYVEDSVAGILKVIELEPPEAVEIGTGVETRLGDLADWLSKRLDKPIVQVPEREIDVVKRRRIDDIDKLRTNIDFQPKWELYDALDKCVDDYFF